MNCNIDRSHFRATVGEVKSSPCHKCSRYITFCPRAYPALWCLACAWRLDPAGALAARRRGNSSVFPRCTEEISNVKSRHNVTKRIHHNAIDSAISYIQDSHRPATPHLCSSQNRQAPHTSLTSHRRSELRFSPFTRNPLYHHLSGRSRNGLFSLPVAMR